MPAKMEQVQAAVANRNKAMSHPLRAKILLLLGEVPASPAELADELQETSFAEGKTRSALTSDITHQIDRLLRWKCIQVVDERKRGSLVQFIYSATEQHFVDTEDWEVLSSEAKDSNRRQFAQTHIDNLVAWLGNDGGMDKHFHVTSDRYWLDQEGRDRFMEITERARLEFESEAADAARRIAEQDSEGIRVASMLACIEVPSKAATKRS